VRDPHRGPTSAATEVPFGITLTVDAGVRTVDFSRLPITPLRHQMRRHAVHLHRPRRQRKEPCIGKGLPRRRIPPLRTSLGFTSGRPGRRPAGRPYRAPRAVPGPRGPHPRVCRSRTHCRASGAQGVRSTRTGSRVAA
jgi:hypothetical protein